MELDILSKKVESEFYWFHLQLDNWSCSEHYLY